jgi:Nif-specific regulatory protein
LPPLRDRREDIPLLLEHFLAKANRENNRKVRITGRALQAMLAYDWPGNVRELENCVERMVVLARRGLVLPDDLPLAIETPAEGSKGRPSQPSTAPGPRSSGRSRAAELSTLRDVEREQIIQALARADGVQARAAALLGITPRQLGYRLGKHGIVRGFQVAGEPVSLDG